MMRHSTYAFVLAWFSGGLFTLAVFLWALGKVEKIAGVALLAALIPLWGLAGRRLQQYERQALLDPLYPVLEQLKGNLTDEESNRLHRKILRQDGPTAEEMQRMVQLRERVLAAAGRGYSTWPPLW